MARILLVEDNELNRDMLSRRLRRRGYEVVLAVDGAEAVAIAPAQSFDLVLMDMSLPIIDGWEATRQIKANPQTQSLPIIALTAHAMVGDRERAMTAGCDDYDTKPVDLKRLLGKVKAFLPVEHEPSPVAPTKVVAARAVPSTHPALGKQDNPRILVVDDNADNRDLLTRRLQRRGYHAIHAESGEVALQLLQQPSDLALILLDIMMPGMDGIETLQQIRQRYSRFQLPVVMVTAKSQSDDMVQAFEQGANDYITKPIDFDVALARIESHLATSQTIQTSTAASSNKVAVVPNPSSSAVASAQVIAQFTPVADAKKSTQAAALEPSATVAARAQQLSSPDASRSEVPGTEDSGLSQGHHSSAEQYQIQLPLAQEPLGPVAIAQVIATQQLALLQTFDLPASTLYPMLSAALSQELAQLGPLRVQFANLSTGCINQTLYIAHDLGPKGCSEDLLQAELSSHQPWPLDSVVTLLSQLLQLLEPFHQRNQVHGGLNPRCFIRRDGDLQLVDSGLGKRVLMRASQESSEYRKRLLMQRNYLPMEQRIGRPVLSSDLYAIGLIGLQALTGFPLAELKMSSVPASRSAGAGASQPGLAWQHQVDIPAALTDWFENLVSSNPTERYPHAMAARAALLPLYNCLTPIF